MIGLRIDFELSDEVTEMAYPLHLDGLIAYAATEENQGDWRNITLPLAQQDGIFKASAIHFVRGGRRLIQRVQKTDEDLIVAGPGSYLSAGRKREQFNLSSGEFKNSLYFTPCFDCYNAYAFCVGEKDKIQYLLSKYIRTIGPHGRLGKGRIANITISEDVTAEQRWKERVLTWCPNVDDYHPIQSAVTFPYWKPENIQSGWIHNSVA